MRSLQPTRGPSSHYAGTPILDFPPKSCEKYISLVRKTFSLCFVVAARTDKDKEQNGKRMKKNDDNIQNL